MSSIAQAPVIADALANIDYIIIIILPQCSRVI